MKQMEKHKTNLQKKGINLALPSFLLHSSDIQASSALHTPVLSIEKATKDLTNQERRNSSKEIKVISPPIG